MNPRPLYRWKSFWFGILVLGFLGWAWHDSYKNESIIALTLFNRHLQVVRSEGATSFYWFGKDHGGGNGFELKAARSEGPAFMEVFLKERWGQYRSAISDSLVFFSCLGLWGGWLAWRWRRLKRWQTKVSP